MLKLTESLDAPLRNSIMSLWEEYEGGNTPEAKSVKAMNKLEVMLQHTQGRNPPDFNYKFNVAYGMQYINSDPLFQCIREIMDKDTRRRMEESATNSADGTNSQ